MRRPPHLPLLPETVARAFTSACHAELSALKPGNVHRHATGHGMEVVQFEAAAAAAAPHIADVRYSAGARMHAAVAASMAAAGCNTNLGIVLLCAPLAVAAEAAGPDQDLKMRVRKVLADLNQDDARDVYAAIRLANPGGLGKSEAADVAEPPSLGLVEAMRIAAPKDRIAANYISGFTDIFDDHLPRLRTIETAAHAREIHHDWVVTTLHLDMLARHPDSHIRRKFGMEAAAHVQALARSVCAAMGPVATPDMLDRLRKLDALLKSSGWNPGTTADFVVATLFADALTSPDRH